MARQEHSRWRAVRCRAAINSMKICSIQVCQTLSKGKFVESNRWFGAVRFETGQEFLCEVNSRLYAKG